MRMNTNMQLTDGGGSSSKKKKPASSNKYPTRTTLPGGVIQQNNANKWLETQGKYNPVSVQKPVVYNPNKNQYENVNLPSSGSPRLPGSSGNGSGSSGGSGNSGGSSGGGGYTPYVPQQYQSTYTPGTYASKYGANIENLLSQIQNRKFEYDMNADPLYQQYRDQYVRGGNLAMRDAAAQAAALTGGYGSSYATTAASQAYDNYLSGLNSKALELYNIAAQDYNTETADLYNQLNEYNQLENQNYNQWRDAEEAKFQADQVNYTRWNDYQNALAAAAAEAARYQNQVSQASSNRAAEIELKDVRTAKEQAEYDGVPNDVLSALSSMQNYMNEIGRGGHYLNPTTLRKYAYGKFGELSDSEMSYLFDALGINFADTDISEERKDYE